MYIKFLVAVALCVATSFVIWQYQGLDQDAQDLDTSKTNQDHQKSVIDSSPEAINTETQQLPYQSEHGDLVSSLRGIYFDRDLGVDENGDLRISSDLKDIFDFFFSAIEEESLETVLARIEEYLNYKLEEPALTQALQSLESYVAYKTAVMDLELAFSSRIESFTTDGSMSSLSGSYLDLIDERLQLLKSIRAENLGLEMHEAFYSEREQYDAYMIERLRINADKAMNNEQKSAALESLDAQMPAEFIESRSGANPVQVLRESTTDNQELTGEELYNARVEAVGEEAAERLTSLDSQRKEWDSRYTSYTSQRDEILLNDAYSDEVKVTELELLRDSLFSSSEKVRVIALDRIQ
ncbi:MAG: hypothetical protein MK096_12285 [Oleiphilaceae bacterium]|nr:hypothetical protein [Oleiphilaceae bacterium]